MKKNIFILIILILVYSCTKPIILKNSLAGKSGYAQFGYSAQRNFYYHTEISDSLNLLYSVHTNGSLGATTPAIYDNYLFVPDLSGRIYCFDNESGKYLGSEIHKGAVSTAPVLYRQRLAFLLNDFDESYSTFFYYDFYLPKYLKQIKIESGLNNEIVFNGKAFYVLSGKGILYKINLIGNVEWRTDTGVISNSSPAFSSGRIIFGNRNGELLFVDEEGEIENRIQLSSSSIEAPIVVKDKIVYIADSEGNLFSAEEETGVINWKFKSGAKILSAPVAAGNRIFIGNLAGNMFAVSKITGKRVWRNNIGGVINITPAVFDDFILQPNQNKTLYFIDRKTGGVKKEMKFDYRLSMVPIFYGGKLYVGTDRGYVFVYQAGGK